MVTTVENSVDLNQIRTKTGVNNVIIRGTKIVMDIDEFFVRSILSNMETWHPNLRLHNIDFEEKQLVFEVET